MTSTAKTMAQTDDEFVPLGVATTEAVAAAMGAGLDGDERRQVAALVDLLEWIETQDDQRQVRYAAAVVAGFFRRLDADGGDR